MSTNFPDAPPPEPEGQAAPEPPAPDPWSTATQHGFAPDYDWAQVREDQNRIRALEDSNVGPDYWVEIGRKYGLPEGMTWRDVQAATQEYHQRMNDPWAQQQPPPQPQFYPPQQQWANTPDPNQWQPQPQYQQPEPQYDPRQIVEVAEQRAQRMMEERFAQQQQQWEAERAQERAQAELQRELDRIADSHLKGWKPEQQQVALRNISNDAVQRMMTAAQQGRVVGDIKSNVEAAWRDFETLKSAWLGATMNQSQAAPVGVGTANGLPPGSGTSMTGRTPAQTMEQMRQQMAAAFEIDPSSLD